MSSCRLLSTSRAMQASNVPTLDGLSTFWRTMISAVLIIRYGCGRGLCFVINALLRKKKSAYLPSTRWAYNGEVCRGQWHFGAGVQGGNLGP